MKITFYEKGDQDPGEWFTWREEKGEKVRFKIRRLPVSVSDAIEEQHFGRKLALKIRRGETVQEIDKAKSRSANRDKAAYCLEDSEGFVLVPGGEAAAAILTRALGREVAIDEEVAFDGKWNDKLKGAVLEEIIPSLMDWIGKRAAELAGVLADQEEEALGN